MELLRDVLWMIRPGETEAADAMISRFARRINRSEWRRRGRPTAELSAL